MAATLPSTSLRWLALLPAGLLAVSPAFLQAGEAPHPKAADPQARVNIAADVAVSHRFKSDIDGGGEVGVSRAMIGGTVTVPLGPQLRLDTALAHRFADWSFGDRGRFGGERPWTEVQSLTLSAQLNYQFDDSWSVFAGPILTFAGEDGARVADTISGGGVMGATYRAGETLRISLGLAATSQLEDDVTFSPVLLFHWAFAEGWALRSARIDAGSVGSMGVELMRHLNEQWSLAAGTGYQAERFRLDSGGFSSRGIGEDRSWPLYFRTVYRPSDRWTLSALAGISFGGELRIGDAHNNLLIKDDYDPAPFLGLNALMRF